MTLRSSLDAMQSNTTPPPLPPEAIDPLPAPHKHIPLVLSTVLEAGTLLRHFRRAYGFKSSLAFIFQMSALVSSILLNHLSISPDPGSRNPSFLQDDIETAFSEAYRCLLAIGTRVLIGRGVARMVYHSSRSAGTVLPEATRRLMGVVNEVVWTSTDVRLISSSFPNWAMIKGKGKDGSASGSGGKGDEARMESLLKGWEELSLET